MKIKEKPKTKWRLWLGCFVLLAAVVAGGGVYRAYLARQWMGVGRFTIIHLSPEVVIESIDPVSEEGVRVKVPESLVVQTAYGKGSWKAGALGELAQRHGLKWAGDSLADFLGISYSLLDQQMQTWDKWKWDGLSKRAKWKEVTLDESAYVAERIDIDDERVLGLDSRWDDQLRNYFLATDIAVEQMEIAVVNTTSAAGIAAKAARILEANGIRVVKLDSVDKPQPKCSLAIEESRRNLNAVKLIQQLWRCDLTFSTADARVSLYLGEDLAARFAR